MANTIVNICVLQNILNVVDVAGQGDWPPYTTTNDVFTIRIVIKTKHVGKY